ncbi:ATP-binding cassette subfamily C protein CydC [Luteibacter sp. Sphag1AF]|uniref:thiol reductant ABC exporter subunit CydC n=1 Tax=Luteibacter sp. Sphag1AF TaxID=2587031 RepID=UPI00161B7184|nr:thiol reductant ABC exporter subunit CydC [Luteibacter sp. Sphag1AF]MBB3228258.1 ATP-binding cassette subfamily C protein CydC [Luteibacter sp. Sphag1AF]
MNRSPWKRLFSLLRDDRLRMLAGAGAALLSTVAGIALLALSGHFITSMALAGVGGLAINYYTPAALIRLFAIVRTGGRYAERLITHDATLSILARLRVWLFARVIPLAPGALGKLGSAQVYSRIRADIDTLEHAYLGVLTPAAVALLTSGGVVVLTGCYSVPLALVLAALYLLAGVVLPWWAARRGSLPAATADEWAEAMRWQIADGLRGRAELALFGVEDEHARRLAETLKLRQSALRRVQRLQALADAALALLVPLAAASALAIGMLAVHQHRLQPAELTMLVLLGVAGFDAVAPLPSAWARLGAVRAAALRVFELADRTPVVSDPPDTPDVPIPQAHPDLHLREVWLNYGEAHWALKGVNLSIPYGRRVALVGASGAGKSSLVAALCRFAPWQGRINLGGVPLDALPGDVARTYFAVVEQKPYLFDGSLRDNLLLACPDANDDRLIEALHHAQLGDYLQALPRGLNTWIGENGVGVSGGEGRRIAIARALLSSAPILLLDEPTEGLDAHTSRALYASLAAQADGRTMLIITHKPGALQELVDDVVTMVDGVVTAPSPVLDPDWQRHRG